MRAGDVTRSGLFAIIAAEVLDLLHLVAQGLSLRRHSYRIQRILPQ